MTLDVEIGRPQEPWDGLLLLDKPSGPTSHDMVDLLRRATGESRIGHAGTLDPAASGLLPVAFGRATRLLRFLPASPKVYRGGLKLGVTTDTDDLTGKTTSHHSGPLPSPAEVAAAARALEGRQLQRPPAYSARKIGGERMYRLARRGIVVTGEGREVEISRFRLVAVTSDEYSFDVAVSGGTYVRALARDLGAALGCGAALGALRRTAIGPMEVASAVTLPAEPESIPEAVRRALSPPERMPLVPPAVVLGEAEDGVRFVAGRTVPAAADGGPDGAVRVFDTEGTLLGIGELREGRLCPRVVVVRRLPAPVSRS